MLAASGGEERGAPPFLAAAIIGLALVVAAQILGQARDGWFAFEGRLIDPDGYMRLLRVERLAETTASRTRRGRNPRSTSTCRSRICTESR